jgi:putative membrane protein
MMFFGFFWFLIFIGLIIAAVYFIQSGIKGKGVLQALNEKKEDPLQILKMRYAKGEISEEEYKRMKKELIQ